MWQPGITVQATLYICHSVSTAALLWLTTTGDAMCCHFTRSLNICSQPLHYYLHHTHSA